MLQNIQVYEIAVTFVRFFELGAVWLGITKLLFGIRVFNFFEFMFKLAWEFRDVSNRVTKDCKFPAPKYFTASIFVLPVYTSRPATSGP